MGAATGAESRRCAASGIALRQALWCDAGDDPADMADMADMADIMSPRRFVALNGWRAQRVKITTTAGVARPGQWTFIAAFAKICAGMFT
jgi:hypothetical protein